MSFVSDPAKSSCLRRLVLVLLLAGPLLCGSADARDKSVNLTIKFKVVDKESGKGVSKVRFVISRGEPFGNSTLEDINDVTDAYGVYNKNDKDFLVGPTHQHKLSIDANDYVHYERLLAEEEFLEASQREDKVLDLGEIKLDKAAGVKSVNANAQTGNTNADAAANMDVSNTGAGANANGKSASGPTEPGFFTPIINFFGGAMVFLSRGVWWLGILFLLLLVGVGVAWYMGYGVKISNKAHTPTGSDGQSDGGKESEEVYLRRIDVALASVDERLGKVEAAVTAKGSGESNKDSKGGQNQRQEDETFKLLIKASLREEFENFTRNNPTLLTTGVPQTPQGNRPWGGAAQPTAQTVPPVPTPPVPKPQAEHARQSYLGLLNNQLIGSEPIHLDSEGTSSVFGKLEDSNIYLQQVGHSQGTFVLFTEDNRTGYVFPNPALAYQEKALREVFRGLTEAEFNGAKQRIEPVPVTRVGDRRWRIGEAASP